MIEIEAIGPGDRLLHIGPHKTGSTAIQVALAGARERLAESGVYYPEGKTRRGDASAELFPAVRWDDGRATPLWDALVAEIAGAGAGRRVCVSDERFGKATPEQAARVVRDLGAGREHVVAVARVYDRYLPSQWQERVKSGVADTYEQWLRIILDPTIAHSEHRNVWHAHDTGALIERWTRVVDPQRFTLILAEEGNRLQLPQAFERLLALPAGTLAVNPGRSNQSLSMGQVELLRAVNSRLHDEGLPHETHLRLVRLARRQIRSTVPPSGPPRPRTPRWARELIAQRNEERIELLRRSDVRVVGDLDWMRGLPVDEPVPGEGDSEPVDPGAPAVSRLVEDLLGRI